MPARLARCLSASELIRASRLSSALDRARFARARGWLRLLLSRYLDADPAGLPLCEGSAGKPALLGGALPHPLRFNLAHSDGLALYAVTWRLEVGVDVERIREDFPIDEVLDTFLPENQRADLEAMPQPQRRQAAFDCWTRYEACLKARGQGVKPPLESGRQHRLAAHGAEADEAACWRLHAVDAGPGFSASVAVAGDAIVPSRPTPLAK